MVINGAGNALRVSRCPCEDHIDRSGKQFSKNRPILSAPAGASAAAGVGRCVKVFKRLNRLVAAVQQRHLRTQGSPHDTVSLVHVQRSTPNHTAGFVAFLQWGGSRLLNGCCESRDRALDHRITRREGQTEMPWRFKTGAWNAEDLVIGKQFAE
jgi:hypothetical protein